MSKRLTLDETINQLDKRNKLTIENLKHHLDNIEHCAKIDTTYGSVSHANSMAFSKQVIVNAFKALKGSGDK